MTCPFLSQVVAIERARGALSTRSYSSDMDIAVLVRAAAAATGLDEAQVSSLAAARTLGAEATPAAAAALGYLDLHKLVFAHHAEIPFIESQIKYFHSVLLRHDETAASHRRAYRLTAAGVSAPPPDHVPALMSELVASTRASLDDPGSHPLVVAGDFLFMFLAVSPFAAGNAQLALGLANYLLLLHGYDHVRAAPLEPALAPLVTSGSNMATLPDVFISKFLDAVSATQREALGGAAAVRPRVNDRQERILAILAERGAAKIGDLLPRIGQPRATTKKDLRDLVANGLLVTSGVRKGTVYRLP